MSSGLSWVGAAFMLVASVLGFGLQTAVAFCPSQQLPAKHVRAHADHVRARFRSTLPSSRTGMAMGFSFTFPTFGKPKQATKTNADVLSEELLTLLSDKSRNVDDADVMEKIERLEAAGVTFNEAYLFDDRPWRVLWKTNTAWQRYFDPFNSVTDNRAYQLYKKDGSVTNIAQAFGDKLYVTVDGQGTPATANKELPYAVNVEVYRAWLHTLGRKIPLDFIKGNGTTFVVYNDPKLRVFRSDTGGVVVQTKAEETVLA